MVANNAGPGVHVGGKRLFGVRALRRCRNAECGGTRFHEIRGHTKRCLVCDHESPGRMVQRDVEVSHLADGSIDIMFVTSGNWDRIYID